MVVLIGRLSYSRGIWCQGCVMFVRLIELPGENGVNLPLDVIRSNVYTGSVVHTRLKTGCATELQVNV